MKFEVKKIKNEETKEWLLYKHYLKRMTSISYAFGLFNKNILVGVCTFGNAVPLQMKKSICGDRYMDIVYELNRLCINDNLPKNTALFFVSSCIKKLPKPTIVVSYADKSIGHTGYIYQACNFYFTGESHTQKDWVLKGSEHLHSRTLMDEFSFEENRVQKLKDKYGDRLYQVERPPKNRYVLFWGTKKQKKQLKKASRFEAQPYPKDINTRYDSSHKIKPQLRMF